MNNDSKMLAEAYDQVAENKELLIDKFLKRLLFVYKFVIKDRYDDIYNKRDEEELEKLKNLLQKFLKTPEYEKYISTKLKEYGISLSVITDTPTERDIISIKEMDFRDPK